jgi:hypothetical protein
MKHRWAVQWFFESRIRAPKMYAPFLLATLCPRFADAVILVIRPVIPCNVKQLL